MKDTIIAVFQEVAASQGQKLAPMSDDLPLWESGLNSLSMAIVVATLEDTLGVNPFDSTALESLPVTLGEFVKLYERAAA